MNSIKTANRTSGIYMITNKITDKSYIGVSCNIERRWRDHKRKSKNYVGRKALYHAFNKYGVDNFKFEVLKECNSKEASIIEDEYINKFNTKIPNGYNMIEGGNARSGFETRNNLLSLDEIKEIRIIYRDLKVSAAKAYEIFSAKDKITEKGFEAIYNFRSWTDIMPEVYDPDRTKELRSEITSNFKKMARSQKPKLDKVKLNELVYDLMNTDISYRQLNEKYDIDTKTIRRINSGDHKSYTEMHDIDIFPIRKKIDKK